MRQRPVDDVSCLPTYGFGAKSPIWWGTLGFIALEGMGFALAAGVYLYLVATNSAWPLSAAPPNHWPGTIPLLLLLASLWPNVLADRAARAENLRGVRLWLVVMTAIGLVALCIRAYEFTQLKVSWD